MTDTASGDDEPTRIAVTGTPGTGKTTATAELQQERDDVDVVHLNDVVQSESLHQDVDETRESVVVDVDALADWVDEYVAATDARTVVLDSHLAHHLDANRVAVLRCRPDVLERRLRDRGEPDAKATENAESEALDVVLSEAVEYHGTDAVYEIPTTNADPGTVASEIATVVADDCEPSAGTVDYIEYLQDT